MILIELHFCSRSVKTCSCVSPIEKFQSEVSSNLGLEVITAIDQHHRRIE
jgi:hypothetical protein